MTEVPVISLIQQMSCQRAHFSEIDLRISKPVLGNRGNDGARSAITCRLELEKGRILAIQGDEFRVGSLLDQSPML